jgi:uncharacterized protein YecT (DUF1311 family)
MRGVVWALLLMVQNPAADQKKAQAALQSQTGRIGKDCPDAGTTMAINSCMTDVEKQTEADFALFLSSLRSLLKASAPALAKFETSQTVWEKYRASACDAVGTLYDGGTIKYSSVEGCKVRLTRSRMQDLNDLYYDTLHN